MEASLLLINKGRFLDLAGKSGFDVLIASTKENVLYSTQYWSLSQWTSPDVDISVYAILPVESNSKAVLVAPMSDTDLVNDDEAEIERVVPYGTFYYEHAAAHEGIRLGELTPKANGIEALLFSLKELGFEDARIGLDEGARQSDLEKLRQVLPKADIKPANWLFERIRAVKTGEEVLRLRKAAEVTDESIRVALACASDQSTERDVATEFELALVERGARPDFTVVGFAERTAFPNAQASDRKLMVGEAIRFDVGCVYEHYHSDLSRMAVLGESSEKLRRYYNAILSGHERGMEMVSAGVRTSDIFDEIVRTVQQNGIPHYKRHHCGHGIGIAGYDQPMISPNSAEVLEEGMVLCIEPPYYELGWGGVQVEDTVLVKQDGAQLLSSSDRRLVVL